jgi:hypothetical protein
MLYKIQPAKINMVVGYVASNHMVEDYYFNQPDSVYNINVRGKLNFTPNIDAIQILKRAKLMDILSSVPVPNSGMLVSDKLLDTFMKFVIPFETQIFDAYTVHKDERHHYNYFYIYKSHEDMQVDWERSVFKDGFLVDKPILGTYKKDIQQIRNTIVKGESIRSTDPVKMVINTSFIKSDIIKLDFSHNGYYVSKKLKTAIEEAGCQGVDLIPIDELGFEVEFV